MRKTGIGVLIALAIVFVAMFAAGELGGEVVKLTTRSAGGSSFETPLWIVEDEGSLWLRAVNPASSWLTRVRAESRVTLERAGQSSEYHAEVVAGRSEQINRKMADAYGWADRLLGGMRDAGQAVAIRLVPLDG